MHGDGGPAPDLSGLLTVAWRRHAQGDFANAEALARAVLRHAPHEPRALHIAGETALRRGDAAAALSLVGDAVRLAPTYAEARNTLGAAYKAAGDPAAAARHYRAAIRLRPDLTAAHSNLGEALLAAGRPKDACRALRRALALAPHDPTAHLNLSQALLVLDHPTDAVDRARRSLALRPDWAAAHAALGVALRAADRPHESVAALARSVELAPHVADYRNNLGNALRETGDLAGAIAAFRRAVALAPNHAAAHNNLGAALLMTGAFAEGWREFEWRWRMEPHCRLCERRTIPAWDGRALAGRKLLVWAEQGVGDALLMSSMLQGFQPDGTVTLSVDPRLVSLLGRSFPAFDVTAETGLDERRFDVQACLSALGPIQRNDNVAFARTTPHLVADPGRVAYYRSALAALGPGPRIGLSWRSASPAFKRKSVPLDEWAPIFAVQGLRFVDLQYDDTREERALAAERFGVEIHRDSELDPWADIDGMAALISSLDGVVTVSNVNAHLAGGLGVPVHVVTTGNTLWYWPPDDGRTPWYRSARIWRAGGGAMTKIAAELTCR